MNGELLAVLEYLEREKGISRDVLIEAVTSSLVSATKKSAGEVKNLNVEMDRETGNIKAYYDVTVVEKVSVPEEEISLSTAVEIKSDAKLGDVIRRPITAKNFGRIAAQTAKQVIIQRIKQAEQEIVFNEYKDRVGDIVTAIVRKHERGNVILDLGRAEAILPAKEQSPREGYGVGRRFKVYIVDVKDAPKGPEIVVSRTHPDLLRKLFELEVPEIGEGTVEIKAVARDPGYRSKIAVASKSEKVDAVGACVGMRGARVKDVVRELNGENVDIVRWHEDMAAYITNALNPAKLRGVKLLDNDRAEVLVDDSQFSLAVGRRGQSVRLVAKLTGWKIDLKKVSEVEREQKEAKVNLKELEDLIGKKTLNSLKAGGYKTVGELRKATDDELAKLSGIGEKTVTKIKKAVADFSLEQEKEQEAAAAAAQPDAEENLSEKGKVEGADSPEAEAKVEKEEESSEDTKKKEETS